MRIVCISDSHNQHSRINIPEGDLIIHSGDATNRGEFSETFAFMYWFSNLKFKHKIFVPGNHDWYFQLTNLSMIRSEYKDIHILIDQSVEIEGNLIYGSPWQPEFANWAFNLPRKGQELKEKWAAIPDNTNILITHGPLFQMLDQVAKRQQHLGCELLKERISQLHELKPHQFGHIHGGYGKRFNNGKCFVNASICNEDYAPVNAPIIFDI